MDIRLRNKKIIAKIEEIKAIEGLKSNSKTIEMLLDSYEEKILLENLLQKRTRIQTKKAAV